MKYVGYENLNVLSSVVFQRLHLDIQMGEHPVDHNAEKTKDNMEDLENSLTHLRDQMINIIKQQEYQRVNTQTTVFSRNNDNHKVVVTKHKDCPFYRRRRRCSGK